MILARRKVAFLVLSGLALAAAGCGKSNNEGKIVGKWKATAVPGMSPEEQKKLNDLPPEALSAVIEFTADGRMIMSLNMLGQSQQLGTAKYTLGSGDWVNLTDLSPPQNGKTQSRDRVVISGDTMTVDTEKGEKITLTRVK
jgi:hypothetical protein